MRGTGRQGEPMTVTPIRTTLAVESADLEAVDLRRLQGHPQGHPRRALRRHHRGRQRRPRATGRRSRPSASGCAPSCGLLISHAEHEDDVRAARDRGPRAGAVRDHRRPTRARGADGRASRCSATGPSTSAPNRRRFMTHRLYLGLASFTAEYLQHQAFEELEVMAGAVPAVSVRRVARDRQGDRREPHARGDGGSRR